MSAAEVDAAVSSSTSSPRTFTGEGLLRAGVPSSHPSPVLAMLAVIRSLIE